MVEKEPNFEIVLPDGTIYSPHSKQNEDAEKKDNHAIRGYNPDGKSKTMKFMTKSNCERCGECCRRDTPLILKEDIKLLNNGIINENEIYTIREGEKIRSSIDGDYYYSSMELIKIKPIFGSFTCIFYDNNEGCTIYENRPTVCREYECWSENLTITGIEKRRLTRSDLFNRVEILNEAIKKQEENISLYKFSDLIKKLKNGENENFEKIVQMILYDNSLRDWAKEKLEIKEEILPLIFGRSLIELMPIYGLLLEKENNNFIIKTVQEEEE